MRLRDLLEASGISAAQSGGKERLFQSTCQGLERISGRADGEVSLWYVPGRIEVLGKHTDYAGGPSLLCAAERGFCVAASPRDDSLLRIADEAKKVEDRFPISAEIASGEGTWTLYPRTVARRLARNFGPALRGANLAFASDLPPSAGMSSSSAFIIAVFSALSEVNGLEEREEYRSALRTPEDLSGYLGCVENGRPFGPLGGDRGVGTFGGSEDHAAILCCRPGLFSLFSFAPVREERRLPMPRGLSFVIGVSGVEACKTGAARALYNRASRAAEAIHQLCRSVGGDSGASLYDLVTASPEAPGKIRHVLERMPEGEFPRRVLLDRFEQFCEEACRIIPESLRALERGDLAALGEAVDRSQRAAENLLGNQVPQTAALAALARSLGARAASAFGGGFGGSVWALVDSSEADSFPAAWREAYRRRFPDARGDEFFSTAAGPGRFRVRPAVPGRRPRS